MRRSDLGNTSQVRSHLRFFLGAFFMSNKQARNVCWTYFCDYSEDKEQEILDAFEEWPVCTYCVFQWERCPETGRTHVQGYSEFRSGVRWSTIQRRLPGAHCESRRGSAEEAKAYCTKEETRLEGTNPKVALIWMF